MCIESFPNFSRLFANDLKFSNDLICRHLYEADSNIPISLKTYICVYLDLQTVVGVIEPSQLFFKEGFQFFHFSV